jgi:hypothetical protein
MRREPINRGCVIQQMRQKEKADVEKKGLLNQLSRPVDISNEEALKRATAIIHRALNNGLIQVEVLRSPNALCTDQGGAISPLTPP